MNFGYSQCAFRPRSAVVANGLSWLLLGLCALELTAAHARQTSANIFPLAADEPVEIHLSAQPLKAALARFTHLVGWEFIYDATLVDHLISTPVEGRQRPDEALRQLLRGTGLIASRATANMLTLERSATAQSYEEERDSALGASTPGYYASIQDSLEQAFCGLKSLPGDLQFSMGLWLNPDGSVDRVLFLDPAVVGPWSNAISRALKRVVIPEPLPEDASKALIVMVLPGIQARCPRTGDEVHRRDALRLRPAA